MSPPAAVGGTWVEASSGMTGARIRPAVSRLLVSLLLGYGIGRTVITAAKLFE